MWSRSRHLGLEIVSRRTDVSPRSRLGLGLFRLVGPDVLAGGVALCGQQLPRTETNLPQSVQFVFIRFAYQQMFAAGQGLVCFVCNHAITVFNETTCHYLCVALHAMSSTHAMALNTTEHVGQLLCSVAIISDTVVCMYQLQVLFLPSMHSLSSLSVQGYRARIRCGLCACVAQFHIPATTSGAAMLHSLLHYAFLKIFSLLQAKTLPRQLLR